MVIFASNDILGQHITVQPVPAPFSTNELSNNRSKAGGNNQKEILFNLGNQFIYVISYIFGLCLHPIYNKFKKVKNYRNLKFN